MSADSSKRQTKQGTSGQIVLPQPVNDPSIIDSVAGFIHEVVPQACQSVLSATGASEQNKESIVWAKFHTTDYNDPENFLADTECQSDSVPPLLIILGYGSGVQVWGVSGGGEGRELVSYPQGNVRCLQILYSPQVHPSKDPLFSKRPLIAIVDNTGPGPQYQTLNFISLRTAEVVKSIKFKTPICDVVCNKKSIVVTFTERIAVFDVLTLDDRLTVTTCNLSPGINPNPVALGPRWLAYCDKKLTSWQRSSGGCEDEGAQSYTATVIHAAKSLGKGLRDLSGSLTGTVTPPQSNTSQPGIVTVLDIETPKSIKHQGGDEESSSQSNMVAHFVGHTGPIVAMCFDPSGMLLVVADKHGHRFNVFRLQPHPSSPALAAVHHLYILHRGDTTARVQDMSVSWDSRWVAVSSLRGTTHVFPITPYGGPVAVRTHTTPNVVNRLSRFERSAGLSDGRGSPEGAASVLGGSPRLPPYPHPVVLTPLAQIRRTPTGGESSEPSPAPTVLRLAAKFAPPRALLPPRATPPRTPRHQPKPRVADSLFIVSSYGSLVQYDIEPRSPANVPKDKISYDTGIEVSVEAKGEWVLVRPPCVGSVQPPLSQGNPLLPPVPIPASHTARLVETHSPQLHHPAKGQDDRWLSQVEIITHTGPHRRLWMGPQFSFKSLDQSNASEGGQPEPENIPPRSNPVNMPRRPYLWIESSSGGSVDAPYMTDNSEDDSMHGETRLREDLADAMMDTALHASGGVVEGGEDGQASGVEGLDKRLERRITQFGLVVPVSPVVLPDIRIPIPAPDLASRISTAALREFATDFTIPRSSIITEETAEEETPVSSEIQVQETTVTCSEQSSKENSSSRENPSKWAEVATSTYESPLIAPTPSRVDAQTETSPVEHVVPSVSDKGLNTSIIFEPVLLPLTSSSSDTSAKVSDRSERCSITEKSNSNSSSENGSGQEITVNKSEKGGKKSKKKKGDLKEKNKKVENLVCDLISPFEDMSVPMDQIVASETQKDLVSEELVSEGHLTQELVVQTELLGDDQGLSLVDTTGISLIDITPSNEAPIAAPQETVTLIPSELPPISDFKFEPDSAVITEPLVSMSMIELKDSKHLEKLKEIELTSSLTGSLISKKEGKGKKKRKKDDSKTSLAKDAVKTIPDSKNIQTSKVAPTKFSSSRASPSQDLDVRPTCTKVGTSKASSSKDGPSNVSAKDSVSKDGSLDSVKSDTSKGSSTKDADSRSASTVGDVSSSSSSKEFASTPSSIKDDSGIVFAKDSSSKASKDDTRVSSSKDDDNRISPTKGGSSRASPIQDGYPRPTSKGITSKSSVKDVNPRISSAKPDDSNDGRTCASSTKDDNKSFSSKDKRSKPSSKAGSSRISVKDRAFPMEDHCTITKDEDALRDSTKSDSSSKASTKTDSSRAFSAEDSDFKTSTTSDSTESANAADSEVPAKFDSSKASPFEEGVSRLILTEDSECIVSSTKDDSFQNISKDVYEDVSLIKDESYAVSAGEDGMNKMLTDVSFKITFSDEEPLEASGKEVCDLEVDLPDTDLEIAPLVEFEMEELDILPQVDILDPSLQASFTIGDTLKEPLIKFETSSDEDKTGSKESEESKVESTESTGGSGQEFQQVASKKKSKSAKKNKSQGPKDISIREQKKESSLETLELKDELKESTSSDESPNLNLDSKDSHLIEKVQDRIEIAVEENFADLGVAKETVDRGEEEVVSELVQSEVVESTSDPVSAVDESSDPVSTREETTSDNVNKSDSEFFVSYTEKRKKKRKNIKEKEGSLKCETKESIDAKEESSKKEDATLEVRKSRRESRSKAKSPSPSPKADLAPDSESSDEAVLTEAKPQTPKLPKRKKPSKRSDTSETREIDIETKIKQDGTSDIDYETCSEKKSDGSVDSFFDRIRTIDPFSKLWSGPGGEDNTNVEDRDSVYESCNDEEFSGLVSQVVAESIVDSTAQESGSSLTEEKTDSGDKDPPVTSQSQSKKPKKQKKKKR